MLIAGHRTQPNQRKTNVRANITRRRAAMNGLKDTKGNNKTMHGLREMMLGIKLDRNRPKGRPKMRGVFIPTIKVVVKVTTEVVRAATYGVRIPTTEMVKAPMHGVRVRIPITEVIKAATHGVRILTTEIAKVTTPGARILTIEVVKAAMPGVRILNTEVIKAAMPGVRILSTEVVKAAMPGVRILSTEVVKAAMPGVRILSTVVVKRTHGLKAHQPRILATAGN